MRLYAITLHDLDDQIIALYETRAEAEAQLQKGVDAGSLKPTDDDAGVYWVREWLAKMWIEEVETGTVHRWYKDIFEAL